MKKYKKNTNNNFLKSLEVVIITILTISFIILAYCIYVSITMENKSADTNYEVKKLSTEIELNDNKNISDIIEKVNNSIVGISKIKDKGNTIFLQEGITSLGLGTGFIVSEDGYIITNEHVSGEKYSSCYVTLVTGKIYKADVIWSDSDIDLSIIKINLNKLEYLELGDSDNLKIAQNVYAIGNPIGFEFQRTVTFGIVSALNRTVKLNENDKNIYMEDLIQTDATINPGNSGGPLITQDGKVVGINSVKITTAEGIGFASPINIIKPILENIKNEGEVKSALLGVFAYDKNVIPYINQELNINQSLESGIYVAEVVKGSPAEKAGILEGDILLQIDNLILNKMSDLRTYIYSKKPGDEVNITYFRKNRKENIIVMLKGKI